MKSIYCFTFFFLLSYSTKAQTPFVQTYSSKIYKGTFQTWHVAQDSNQVVYIANNDAVLRYDGVTWNPIPSIKGNFVGALAASPQGKIYVAGRRLIGYLSKSTNGAIVMKSLNEKLPKGTSQDISIRKIVASNSAVVFASPSILYVYQPQKDKIITLKVKPQSLQGINNFNIFCHKDTIYVATADGLLYLEEEALKALPSINKQLKKLAMKYVQPYGATKFLILDQNHAFYLLDVAKNNSITPKPLDSKVSKKIKGKEIFDLQVLSDGSIALNVLDEGLLIISPEGKERYHLTKKTGLLANTVNFIYEDSNRNLWLTGHEVAQILIASPLSHFYQPKENSAAFLSLGRKENQRFLGSLNKIETHQEQSSFDDFVINSQEVWNFFDFGVDGFFAATSKGVYIIKAKQPELVFNTPYVFCVEKVKTAPLTFLVGTYADGIWKLTQENEQWKSTKISGFEEETRFLKADNAGNVWISHHSQGIFRLQLNAQQDSVIYQKLYTQKEGLPDEVNNRIFSSKKGELLFATIDGFYQYNTQKDKFEPNPVYYAALKGKCIYNFVEHQDGNMYLWIGEKQPSQQIGAILKKDKADKMRLDTRPFRAIAVPVNHFIVDVDAPMLVLENGKLWIGNGENIYEYDPSQLEYVTNPFNMSITLVKAGNNQTGNLILMNQQTLLYGEAIAYQFNEMRFEFAAHYFDEENKVEYQYFLVGYDKEWSGWSNQPNAHFTNLSEGKYTLKVKARNIYGVESQEVSFAFQILPPWYRAWWAYLLYSLFSGSGISLLIWFYTKNLQNQKELLQNRVEERTQEIQQKNEEILAMNLRLAEQAEELYQQAEKLQETNQVKDKLFSIISHDLRSPLNQLLSILKIFQAGSFTEKELQRIMPELSTSVQSTVSLTENLLFWANKQLEGLQVEPRKFELLPLIGENIALFTPPALRKGVSLTSHIHSNYVLFADPEMIRLVLRNLINNAVKFCQEGKEVTVAALPKDGYLEIAIQDQGIGIPEDRIPLLFSNQGYSTRGTANEKGTGLGLVLCKEFIEINKGKIWVESKPGKGSTFYFTLPFAKA